MKRVKVALEESVLERFRDAARRRAVKLKKDVAWHDLIREAADWYLRAMEVSPRPVTRPDAVTSGGVR